MVLMAFAMMFAQCGSKPSTSEPADGEENTPEEKLTFTVNGVTFNMIFVKGGTFTMGATEEQGEEAEENFSEMKASTSSPVAVSKEFLPCSFSQSAKILISEQCVAYE